MRVFGYEIRVYVHLDRDAMRDTNVVIGNTRVGALGSAPKEMMGYERR